MTPSVYARKKTPAKNSSSTLRKAPPSRPRSPMDRLIVLLAFLVACATGRHHSLSPRGEFAELERSNERAQPSSQPRTLRSRSCWAASRPCTRRSTPRAPTPTPIPARPTASSATGRTRRGPAKRGHLATRLLSPPFLSGGARARKLAPRRAASLSEMSASLDPATSRMQRDEDCGLSVCEDASPEEDGRMPAASSRRLRPMYAAQQGALCV